MRPEPEDEELAKRLEEFAEALEKQEFVEEGSLQREAAKKIRHLSKHVGILRAMYQNRQLKEGN